jgi:hypothetical protein
VRSSAAKDRPVRAKGVEHGEEKGLDKQENMEDLKILWIVMEPDRIEWVGRRRVSKRHEAGSARSAASALRKKAIYGG